MALDVLAHLRAVAEGFASAEAARRYLVTAGESGALSAPVPTGSTLSIYEWAEANGYRREVQRFIVWLARRAWTRPARPADASDCTACIAFLRAVPVQ